MSQDQKVVRMPVPEDRTDLYDPWHHATDATLHIPGPENTAEPSDFAKRVAKEQSGPTFLIK